MGCGIPRVSPTASWAVEALNERSFFFGGGVLKFLLKFLGSRGKWLPGKVLSLRMFGAVFAIFTLYNTNNLFPSMFYVNKNAISFSSACIF